MGKDDYGPQAPGSLEESALTEPGRGETGPSFDLDARFASATYKNIDGTIIEEISETRSREHICETCYHAAICKHRPAGEAEELLVVISRCLAYEPEQA